MKRDSIGETRYEVECFLCGRWCDIRLSRIGNPYFTCPSCGMRCFVNSPAGKERLGEIAEEKEQDRAV